MDRLAIKGVPSWHGVDGLGLGVELGQGLGLGAGFRVKG